MAQYVWEPGRTDSIQNDFSCMIGPEMFAEFVIPYYERQLEAVDRAWYHLDGEGALRHIDALMKIPKIKAIQWVAGTKNEGYGYHDGSSRWYPYTKKVLVAGKNLMLGVPLSEVESVVHEFGPRGLFIGVHGVPDRETGEVLLKTALKWK